MESFTLTSCKQAITHNDQEPSASVTAIVGRDRNNRRRSKRSTKKAEQQHISSTMNNNEKEEVDKKIATLQKIVPGGERLDEVEKLFEETAEYILQLQCQVKALRFLTAFVEAGNGSYQCHDQKGNMKTKLGG